MGQKLATLKWLHRLERCCGGKADPQNPGLAEMTLEQVMKLRAEMQDDQCGIEWRPPDIDSHPPDFDEIGSVSCPDKIQIAAAQLGRDYHAPPGSGSLSWHERGQNSTGCCAQAPPATGTGRGIARIT
eukprot:5224362-Amphidinium_carterae.1